MRCFRNQLLLLRSYLVLTKPLSHDIRCQRCVSVKIGCKYLDNWSLSSLRQHLMTEAPASGPGCVGRGVDILDRSKLSTYYSSPFNRRVAGRPSIAGRWPIAAWVSESTTRRDTPSCRWGPDGRGCAQGCPVSDAGHPVGQPSIQARVGDRWARTVHAHRDLTGEKSPTQADIPCRGRPHRPSKPMIAWAQSPQRAISFQDTSYEYLTHGRPKSRNIAVLSPHSPVIGPHTPPDRAVVIIGFADRGSAGSHAL